MLALIGDPSQPVNRGNLSPCDPDQQLTRDSRWRRPTYKMRDASSAVCRLVARCDKQVCGLIRCAILPPVFAFERSFGARSMENDGQRIARASGGCAGEVIRCE